MTEPIIMVLGTDGRRHPYNPPRKCVACGGAGRIELPTRDLFEPDRPKRITCKSCRGKGTRTVSHFQTCPNAADFMPGGSLSRRVKEIADEVERT